MRQKKPSENPEGFSIAAGDMRCSHRPYSFVRFGRIVDNRETCFKSNLP